MTARRGTESALLSHAQPPDMIERRRGRGNALAECGSGRDVVSRHRWIALVHSASSETPVGGELARCASAVRPFAFHDRLLRRS